MTLFKVDKILITEKGLESLI